MVEQVVTGIEGGNGMGGEGHGAAACRHMVVNARCAVARAAYDVWEQRVRHEEEVVGSPVNGVKSNTGEAR